MHNVATYFRKLIIYIIRHRIENKSELNNKLNN